MVANILDPFAEPASKKSRLEQFGSNAGIVCPSKHDSSKTTWRTSLIFEIFCGIYSKSDFRIKFLELIFTQYPLFWYFHNVVCPCPLHVLNHISLFKRYRNGRNYLNLKYTSYLSNSGVQSKVEELQSCTYVTGKER